MIATTTAVAARGADRVLAGLPAPGGPTCGRFSVPAEVEVTSGPKTVAVLGDSLTVQSTWAIDERARAAGLATEVDATGGVLTREKQDRPRRRRHHPAAAVIALGTNDRCAGWPTPGVAQLPLPALTIAATWTPT